MPKRREYAATRCCVECGKPATEVHEIFGGCFKQRTDPDPRYWLAVCRLCHDTIQYEPKAKQLARKLTEDLANFDGKTLSELPGVFVEHKEFWKYVYQMVPPPF